MLKNHGIQWRPFIKRGGPRKERKRKDGQVKNNFLLLLLLLLASVFPLQVLAAETGISSRTGSSSINRDILRGIHLLYDDRFDEAEQLFLKIAAQSPDKPEGYFYLAMVSWSRLSEGFWTRDIVEEFRIRIDRTIEVARKRCQSETASSYDYFFLGGALGFKGRFELMKGRWLSSFFLARDAVDALKTCLRMDPENRDVLLGLGTFDYYTDHLSGMLKFLTFLLVHKGSKQEGLRKLHLAASEGIYAATEAKSMLIHIYLFLEKDPLKALPLLEDLGAEYEHNIRFKFLKGVCYIRLQMESRYKETLLYFRQRALSAPTVDRARAWTRRALYLQVVHDLIHGLYGDARSKLNVILSSNDPERDPAMIAWPLIKIGMSYDLEGDREKAMEYYERVLHMENGAGAQFLAKKLLKGPPSKDDPFIGF